MAVAKGAKGAKGTSRRKARAALLTVLTCLLLSACSTTIKIPERTGLGGSIPDDWAEREQALLALDQWSLVGKIAVVQAGQAESAVINHWRQDGTAYQLQLSSAFLGLGNTRLVGDTDYLTILTGGGERYSSSDPEALIQRITGWRLPLSVLPYWVRGIPAPDRMADLGFSEDGQLKTLLQAGWEVHYQRYTEATDARLPLPQLITATNGPARVRLAITRWQVNPGDAGSDSGK